ncbi:MAG: hypothetical protein AAF607_01205 [Pseudomonadota bacterium]
MKKIFSVGAVFAVLATSAVPAAATTVELAFETTQTGAITSTGYSESGYSFDVLSGGNFGTTSINLNFGNPGGAFFIGLFGMIATLQPGQAFELSSDAATPFALLQFDIANNNRPGEQSATFDVVGVTGNAQTVLLDGAGSTSTTYATRQVSTDMFDSFLFVIDNPSGASLFLDNLLVTDMAAVIPIPAAAPLFGGVLIAGAAVARRKVAISSAALRGVKI